MCSDSYELNEDYLCRAFQNINLQPTDRKIIDFNKSVTKYLNFGYNLRESRRLALIDLFTKENKMFEELKKGNILENPGFWKRKQLQLNLISSILPVLYILFPELISHITPQLIASLGVAFTGINSYLTVATTEKIGLT